MLEDKEPIRFFQYFLFPNVFQAFRISIQPTKLILAFLALAAVCLTGHLMDFSKTVVVAPDGTTELDEYVSKAPVVYEHIRLFKETGQRTGVFITLWNFGSHQFHEAMLAIASYNGVEAVKSVVKCFEAIAWAFTFHPVYSVVLFAVTLAMMALFGGAICRIAALQFAQGEKPGLSEAIRFGARKFHSFLTAPIAPIGIIALMGTFIFFLGLAGNIPYAGELCLGLFLPLALLLGALIAIIAIGALGGFNLMFPTIAYEDSDCFDAISRSFSYVYNKPWHMGYYTVVASLYGALCYGFVRVFSFLLLRINYLFLQLGFLKDDEKLAALWPKPDFTDFLGVTEATPGNWSTSVGSFLIYLWVLVVVGLMISFVISFYFSANTIIYALMRKRVDGTVLEEIYSDANEMETESLPLPRPSSEPATEADSKTPEAAEPNQPTSE